MTQLRSRGGCAMRYDQHRPVRPAQQRSSDAAHERTHSSESACADEDLVDLAERRDASEDFRGSSPRAARSSTCVRANAAPSGARAGCARPRGGAHPGPAVDRRPEPAETGGYVWMTLTVSLGPARSRAAMKAARDSSDPSTPTRTLRGERRGPTDAVRSGAGSYWRSGACRSTSTSVTADVAG